MLQDLLIRGRKRADKRDNFVKLNRDHRQPFPHYIRATPATLTITNWQALSSSSLPLSWVSAIPSAPCLLSSSEPHPCFLQNIYIAGKLVPVHLHQRLGTYDSGQWVSSRPLTLPNIRLDDQKLRCALFLLNFHKGSPFLTFFSCNVSTIGCI